jgi:predicted nucleotidyltransferase
MGMPRKPKNQAISALFSSTQGEVMGLLFGQPDRRFMGSELIQLIGRGTGAVHRQLKALDAGGLVTVTKQANQTFYQADPKNPLFPELRGIFLKTTGLAEPLRRALAPFAEEIVAAFVFGSIAGGKERASSDVDLMILVRSEEALSYTEVFQRLSDVERLIARPINPIITTIAEWNGQKGRVGTFAGRVAKGEKVMVLGEESDVA